MFELKVAPSNPYTIYYTISIRYDIILTCLNQAIR